MAVKFKISDHASERFYQRFGHINSSIDLLLENSIPFGGQKGSEYLLLNREHDIVFPIVCDENVKEHTVKTVLTIQQAKANLSLGHGIAFDDDISKKVEAIRKQAEEQRKKDKEEKQEAQNNQINPQDPRITEENAKKLKVLAREFVKKHGYFPGNEERKKLFREIKEILPVSKRNLDEIFLCEIGRLIRERNKCQI